MVYSLSFSSYLIIVPMCLLKSHIIMQCYKSFKNENTKQEVQLRDCTQLHAFKFPSHFLVLLLLHILYGCCYYHPLQAFCIVEGLVCPVIMKMLLLTSADLTKASFKLASRAIKACLSFIVPCFISDTPDPLL